MGGELCLKPVAECRCKRPRLEREGFFGDLKHRHIQTEIEKVFRLCLVRSVRESRKTGRREEQREDGNAMEMERKDRESLVQIEHTSRRTQAKLIVNKVCL